MPNSKFILNNRTLGTISMASAGNVLEICRGTSKDFSYSILDFKVLEWEIHDNTGALVSDSQKVSTIENIFSYQFNIVGTYYIRAIETNECCGKSIPVWLEVNVIDQPTLSNISGTLAACEETALTLPSTPTINNNGSNLSSEEWYLDGILT